jgi:hypothetical protein
MVGGLAHHFRTAGHTVGTQQSLQAWANCTTTWSFETTCETRLSVGGSCNKPFLPTQGLEHRPHRKCDHVPTERDSWMMMMSFILAVHAPSPPAAGSHCQAREDSDPHCRTEFSTQHPAVPDGHSVVFVQSQLRTCKDARPKKRCTHPLVTWRVCGANQSARIPHAGS